MFGFPRRAATGNTMCRSSAGWRPSKSSEARTFLGLATSDSPTFAGVVLPNSAGITIGGFLRLTGSASYTNVRGPDGTTRIWLSAAQSFHDSDTHNFRLSVGTGWGAVSCGAATIYGSPLGTAGAGEVRVGGGQINAAGGGTFGGQCTISSGGTDESLQLKATGSPYLAFYPSGGSTRKGYIQVNTSGNMAIVNEGGSPMFVYGASSAGSAQFDDSSTADDTRLLLWDVTAGSFKRVTRGAADSGGTGYRLLRIAN